LGFDQEPFVDLHIHSTASDGSLTPFEIMDAAEKAGLSAISITDHDSVDGCRDLLHISFPLPLDFMTGVEISAAAPAGMFGGSLHILGYDFDVDDAALNQRLAEQEEARNNRSPKIIHRLNQLGIPLTLEEVQLFAQGSQIGRPHIARAMVKHDIVPSIEEAFDRYIGRDGPAYVDKARLPCDQAMALIREAGGVPVLAHPGLIPVKDAAELDDLVKFLTDRGLQGIEVFYPGHTAEQVEEYRQLAARHDLLMTGGSDFHGALNPHIRLGKGTGSLFVSYTLYEQLLACPRDTARSRPEIVS